MFVKNLRLVAVMAAVALAAVAAACGSDSGDSGDTGDSGNTGGQAAQPASGFVKVRPSEHVYTIDELVTAGFKKSKEYDVAGLDHATAAFYGFYGLDPYNRQEYEVRFYPTHADAVQYGVPMAQEGTGPDAKLMEDDATWDEGLKERRECQGNVLGSHHVGKCINPKYQDYAVLGNMVVLCQGREVSESNTVCEQLFNILPKS